MAGAFAGAAPYAHADAKAGHRVGGGFARLRCFLYRLLVAFVSVVGVVSGHPGRGRAHGLGARVVAFTGRLGQPGNGSGWVR